MSARADTWLTDELTGAAVNLNSGNFWINAPLQAAAGFVMLLPFGLGPLGPVVGMLIALGSLLYSHAHVKRVVKYTPSDWARKHPVKRSDQFKQSIAGWIMYAFAALIIGPVYGVGGLLVLMCCTAAGMDRYAVNRDVIAKPPNHDDVHGDARSATHAEAKQHGIAADSDKGGFWIGVSEITGQWLTYTGELSAVVIGCSGAGKFIYSIANTLLNWRAKHDSALVYDPKGQITAVTMAARKLLGHVVVVINPFNVWRGLLGPSTSYNVLADLDYPDDLFEACVREICLILVPYNPEEKNQHFSSGARALIGAVIMHLRITIGSAVTLPDVNDWLQQSTVKLDALFVEMMKSPVSTVRHVGARFHGELTLQANRDIFETAKDNMAFLSDTVVRRWFAHSDFSFNDLKKKKPHTVYICLPADKAHAYPKATELLLATATRRLIAPPYRPVIGIFDEVATALPSKGGCAEIILRCFALARENGFRLQIFFQDLQQMEDTFKSKDDYNTLLSNAGVVQLLGTGPADTKTPEWASKLIGNMTVWTPSRDSQYHESTTIDEFGGTRVKRDRIPGLFEESGGQSMGKPARSPADIRAMVGNCQQLVWLNGMRNALWMSRKPAYFDIPAMKARASHDPHHEREEWQANSAAASAKEYLKLEAAAAKDHHGIACECRAAKVRAVPLSVADWDNDSVGICEACRFTVVLDTSGNAPLWVWKVKQVGGLQYGVNWRGQA